MRGLFLTRLLVLSLMAAALTFGGLLLLRGQRVVDADPLLQAGWVRTPFTQEECAMLGGMIRAWARTAPQDIVELAERHPGTVTEQQIQLHRAWVEWEAKEALEWVNAGCPDDGIRGAYERKGDPQSRQYRLLQYRTAQEWAEAQGLLPPGESGASPFRYPWE